MRSPPTSDSGPGAARRAQGIARGAAKAAALICTSCKQSLPIAALICSSCKQSLPVADFSKGNQNDDKQNRRCRRCAMERELRTRGVAAPAAAAQAAAAHPRGAGAAVVAGFGSRRDSGIVNPYSANSHSHCFLTCSIASLSCFLAPRST